MPPDRQLPLQRALLPLRFFVGGTFLFAGIDKLVDPAFLRVAGPGSIGEQLETYSRISPLAPLVQAVALPAPLLVGVLVASLEILAGLGALTGLAYRASAILGALLAGTFVLTASWAIRPYYLGPDLPFLAGWITLALAGSGGLYVIGDAIERAFSLPPPASPGADPARRGLLQLVVLAAASLSVAGTAGMLSAFGPAFASEPGQPASPGADGPAGPSGQPGSSPPPGVIATVAAVRASRWTTFRDPGSGDPAVLVALADGTIVAFDAVCTHAACTVAFDRLSGNLLCPCHGAIFDPAHGARVLAGPTDQPLLSLPLRIDPASGSISLAG